MKPARDLMLGLLLVALISLPGCMMIGPDYVRPEAPTSAEWIAATDGTLKGARQRAVLPSPRQPAPRNE